MRLFVSHKTRQQGKPDRDARARAQTAPKAAPPETLRPTPASEPAAATPPAKPAVRELGGPSGPEPTRYGDWERKGICSDF